MASNCCELWPRKWILVENWGSSNHAMRMAKTRRDKQNDEIDYGRRRYCNHMDGSIENKTRLETKTIVI